MTLVDSVDCAEVVNCTAVHLQEQNSTDQAAFSALQPSSDETKLFNRLPYSSDAAP